MCKMFKESLADVSSEQTSSSPFFDGWVSFFGFVFVVFFEQIFSLDIAGLCWTKLPSQSRPPSAFGEKRQERPEGNNYS